MPDAVFVTTLTAGKYDSWNSSRYCLADGLTQSETRNLRILLLSHYFPPEIGAPQARLSEMAEAWGEDGDSVTVLTGMPNHPTGVVPAQYRGRLVMRERKLNFRVVRTWLFATPNEGMVKKTLGHLSFMISSAVLGPFLTGRADVVVVSSPTFFSIFSARFLARVKRARLVIDVRDLWPAIFVELGVLSNRRLISLLERIELACYAAADEVVVVTDGFREDLIRRGVPGEKVTLIPNGVDLERFTPDALDDSHLRERLGAGPDDLLVLYIGAHGISHGLTAVADAAKLCQGERIHVAFVGAGAEKAKLADHVRAEAMTNVSMHDPVPRDSVPGMLAAADVCLVPLRDIPLFASFIPSKMFEFLGAGKAVIGSVAGEAAAILDDAGAIVVPPEDPAALAAAMRELVDDSTRRKTMGAAGRAYVEAHFDRRVLARRFRRVLGRATDRSGRR